MNQRTFGKLLMIFGVLCILVSFGVAHCRELIKIPAFASDTLRMEWKPVKCSYYNLYQRHYAGKDACINLIGYKDSTLVKELNTVHIPYYNSRLAFYLTAVVFTDGGSFEFVVSDTMASFYSTKRHLFGDVNLDAKVDSVDLQTINGFGFGVPRGNPDYQERSDVNGDGDVNLPDFAMVYRRIVGTEKLKAYSTKDFYWQYEQGRK